MMKEGKLLLKANKNYEKLALTILLGIVGTIIIIK
jgi:hypothetical protein